MKLFNMLITYKLSSFQFCLLCFFLGYQLAKGNVSSGYSLGEPPFAQTMVLSRQRPESAIWPRKRRVSGILYISGPGLRVKMILVTMKPTDQQNLGWRYLKFPYCQRKWRLTLSSTSYIISYVGGIIIFILLVPSSLVTEELDRLLGKSPQIGTVSHVWTFESQTFLSFGYATFQHKSQ